MLKLRLDNNKESTGSRLLLKKALWPLRYMITSEERQGPKYLVFITGDLCCSNHSSLKDKWSHNEQSSPMGYQVKSRGITRELDKELSLHCSSIYINTMWSMLQQCVYLMSIHHASSSCPITHPHVFYLRPLYFLHVLWRYTFNLHCTCAHHMYTMRNPCPLTSSLTLALHLDSSRSF